MRVTNEIYIVYDQDMEGNDRSPYYFTEVVDACAFAVANEGKMAYRLPTVVKIASAYDTKDLNNHKFDERITRLDAKTIRTLAEELT